MMQRNIKSLIGWSMEATDGDIGELDEFYFKDDNWVINYMVIKTGNWFLSRKVLISPQALVERITDNNILPVNLSKEQIRKSPDVDTDKPVSRQQDIDLYGHYAWQRYGGSGFYAGGSALVMDNSPFIDEAIFSEADKNDKRSDDDLHLRSTKAITGYHIHASDGDWGYVTDFIFDDLNWKITFLVIDSHQWFGGEKYLVEVGKVKEIQWVNSKVILNLSKDELKISPLFDELLFKHSQTLNAPSKTS